MSAILDLKSLKDGMVLDNAIVYLSTARKMMKKDGKSAYIAGNFTHLDDIVSFKVWDSALVDYMLQTDLVGSVVKASGTVGVYLGNLDLKITSVVPAKSDEFAVTDFLKSVDVPAVFATFTDLVNTTLTPTGVKLLLGIFKSENLFPRFKEEFAGSTMHDSLIGGLMNHTVKMMKICKVLCENEPRMELVPNFKELLMLGVILHDVGKVHEMHLGVYQENSFVTHRILGVEMLVKYKKEIVEFYTENFYYQLISILQGHHGEYGDSPKTLSAYVVHLIDMLESQTTSAFDRISNNQTTLRAGSQTLSVNGDYLAV